MNRPGVPRTPVNQDKNSFKRAIIKHVKGLQEEVITIKRDIHNDAKEIIESEIGDRLSSIDFCLKEVRLFCELLVEKGIATQEEISKKRDEIRRGTEK